MKPKPKTYNVVIERDPEGWYVASVPGLPGCHTQARSMDKLLERVKEVIELCVLEETTPSGPDLEFLGVQRVAVSA